jgi:hypothetical protein
VRKLFRLILVASLLMLQVAYAATVSLSGTFRYPDGSPVNGVLAISLAKSAVNTCSTPAKVIPTATSRIAIVNGTLQGGSVAFVETSCLSPALAYWVKVYDQNKSLLYTDNWYLIATATNPTSVAVDSMDPVFYQQPPVLVSLPGPVVKSPTGNQTIMQPDGTSLLIDSPSHTAALGLNGDTPLQSFALRAEMHSFVPANTSGSYGFIVPDKNLTFTHLTSAELTSGTCSVSPIMEVFDATTATSLASMTMTAAFVDATVSANATAGHRIFIKYTAGTCSVAPANMNLIAQYKTQ